MFTPDEVTKLLRLVRQRVDFHRHWLRERETHSNTPGVKAGRQRHALYLAQYEAIERKLVSVIPTLTFEG